jgi:hypothetical protein
MDMIINTFVGRVVIEEKGGKLMATAVGLADGDR